MFLGRCELNPNRRGAKKLLGSPQAMHAAVMSCFPKSRAADAGRVLWRIDNTDDGVFVYIVAQLAPDWTALAEQAGWPDSRATLTKEYQSFIDSLERGQHYSFRLTANPTHSARLTPDGPLKRLGHLTAGHQEEWLLRRSRDNGFEIPLISNSSETEQDSERALQISQRRVLTFPRKNSEGRVDKVTITQVEYEGVLIVTDPDLLAAALCKGIGRAKAYGCGMLTLAAPPSGEVVSP